MERVEVSSAYKDTCLLTNQGTQYFKKFLIIHFAFVSRVQIFCNGPRDRLFAKQGRDSFRGKSSEPYKHFGTCRSVVAASKLTRCRYSNCKQSGNLQEASSPGVPEEFDPRPYPFSSGLRPRNTGLESNYFFTYHLASARNLAQLFDIQSVGSVHFCF